MYGTASRTRYAAVVHDRERVDRAPAGASVHDVPVLPQDGQNGRGYQMYSAQSSHWQSRRPSAVASQNP